MRDRTGVSVVRDAIARNLRLLMDRRNLSTHQLAKTSGVSQKQISNILQQRSAPTVETVELLARAFGVAGWYLQVAHASIDVETWRQVADLIANYLKSDAGGRGMITSIAQREAAHADGIRDDLTAH